MPARSVHLTASKAAPVIAIRRPVLLIGGHPDCDVRIDLPQVSRRHCRLAQADDRLLIRDLGSRNGVRVNGRRVNEARLELGDEIAVAQIIHRLESKQEAAARPAPPEAAPDPGGPPSPPAPPDNEEILLPLDDHLEGAAYEEVSSGRLKPTRRQKPAMSQSTSRSGLYPAIEIRRQTTISPAWESTS